MMNKGTSISTITGIMVSLFLVGATASMGANQNSESIVNATAIAPLFTSVEVTSTKEISNVVMLFCDTNLSVQKVEEEDLVQVLVGGLWTATVSGIDDAAGAPIATVYVKSGSLKSVDGPGYGMLIPLPDTCGVIPA